MKILLALIFSFNCQAYWSSDSRKLIDNASKSYRFEGPAGYVSLWGGTKRKWSGGSNNGEVRDYYAKKYFKDETLPLYFFSPQKKAPLTIFFPGIFGEHDGDLTPSIIKLLEKNQRSHLAVIPNFLSESYIKAGPIYNNKMVERTDIYAAASLVVKVLKSIPPEQVSHINLVAESLGSFVAAAVLSELNRVKVSVMGDKKINLLLMWPPLKLSKVQENFDKKLINTQKTYEQCSFWYRLPQFLYHFIWQDKPQNTSEEFVKCLDSYLFHGVFAKGIKKSLETKKEVSGEKIKEIPFTFSEFFKIYNEGFYKLIKQNDKKLNLDFWLRRRTLSKSNISIISSKDDFLNTGIDWKYFLERSYLTENDLILLDWGGHSGGLALPVWDKVFQNELFKQND